MKKTVKAIAVILLAALTAYAFAACNNNGKPAKEHDVIALAADILSNCSFEDEYLAEIEERAFALTLTRIESDLVAEKDGVKQIAYYSSAAYPELIICVEAVDEAAAEQVMEKLEAVIDRLIKDYTEYGPEQVVKLNSAVKRVSGKYAVVAVTNDNAAAAKYIDSVL
ncbi:MAG: DUF4358 domain-containing protein [Clostridia bacterium]|nr:DUF4358 domain-containing protein [Clostridia bacterium]